MLNAKLATALTALLVLAVPAAAQAGKIAHRGSINGMAETKVKFVVKKRDGELRRINDMAFIDVPYTCEDGPGGTISSNLESFPISGNDFNRRATLEGAAIEKGSVRVTGEFSNGGRRAAGTVRFSFDLTASTGCGTDEVGWRTRKR